MKAKVVIGASLGDEGKGAITDYLCSQHTGGIVIRHNGGSQAGHTVVEPATHGGRRHVFSHYGSGTLLGRGTFLSEYFIVNPHNFAKETGELVGMGVDWVTVVVDPHALVTTPYDMFINREIERWRGGDRHGSVGVGINETVDRSAEVGFRLVAADLWDEKRTLSMLRAIRRHWVPRRLARLGVGRVSDETQAIFSSDVSEGVFMAAAEAFRQRVHIAGAAVVSRASRHFVFEGAQGLLLDQDNREFFPHVTRGKTGLPNVLALAREMGIDDFEVTYVMRAYMTRHGAGPFPTEFGGAYGGCPMVVRCDDPTNRPHEFQGSLRVGMLDLDRIRRAVAEDMETWIGSGVGGMSCGLAVTCLDQVNGLVSYVLDGEVQTTSDREFVDRVLPDVFGMPVRYTSWGPTRRDVEAHAVKKARVA